MTDQELDRLARELTAATDKLNSEDFLNRQARYLKVEAELAELTESLEGDEAAVVKAQQALTAHVQANYLSGFAQPEPAESDDALFETGPQPGPEGPGYTVVNEFAPASPTWALRDLDADLADHSESYSDDPEPEGWDETASARANGALS